MPKVVAYGEAQRNESGGVDEVVYGVRAENILGAEHLDSVEAAEDAALVIAPNTPGDPPALLPIRVLEEHLKDVLPNLYREAKAIGYTGDFASFCLALSSAPFLPLAGGTLTGDLTLASGKRIVFSRGTLAGAINGLSIKDLAEPSENGDAANKKYVDDTAAELRGQCAPAYSYGQADLEAGVSPLETGKLYFVFE